MGLFNSPQREIRKLAKADHKRRMADTKALMMPGERAIVGAGGTRPDGEAELWLLTNQALHILVRGLPELAERFDHYALTAMPEQPKGPEYGVEVVLNGTTRSIRWFEHNNESASVYLGLLDCYFYKDDPERLREKLRQLGMRL